MFRYVQTQLPGLYRVRLSSDGAAIGEVPFHVAQDPTESDLQLLSKTDRDNLLEPAGVHFVGVRRPNAEGQ